MGYEYAGSALLDVICYILVVGMGLTILFPRNASTGGLDIVTKIMNKYLRMPYDDYISTILTYTKGENAPLFCIDGSFVCVAIVDLWDVL